MEAIESLNVTVGRPIRPMLAERLSDAKAILVKMNGECAAEYKYDGLRIQAHVSTKEVTLFSRRLENITDQFPDVRQLLKKNVEEEAVADGCEGLMIKSIGPDSAYKAGARGWAWIKYKREYKSEMQDSVDLAVVGAFAGRGRRGGTYGALLLAAYDKSDDVFRTVCKCGSGLTDEDLNKLPKLLEKYGISHPHARVDSKVVPDVWFVPGLVLEIVGAEITLSPIHTCGMNKIKPGAGLAIRFPRFTGKYREDKSAEDCTTTDEVVKMYRAQLKKVASNPLAEAA